MKKEMKVTFTFSINETDKTATLEFRAGGKPVVIDVPAELKAYFTSQFSRASPTPLQRRRYATLMRLLGAAYTKGVEDGQAQP